MSHVPDNSPRNRPVRGFTLLEVILVMTVMVILATMVVPRMSGIQSQRDITAIDAVASMVASFAFHDSTGGMPVALTYNDEMRQLRLLVLEPNGDSTPGRATWRIHPFNRPVPIPEEMDIVSVTSDGEPLNPSDFFISTRSASDRPGIQMVLETTMNSATIALSPYALAPVITTSLDRNPRVIREKANLNDMGMEREEW